MQGNLALTWSLPLRSCLTKCYIFIRASRICSSTTMPWSKARSPHMTWCNGPSTPQNQGHCGTRKNRTWNICKRILKRQQNFCPTQTLSKLYKTFIMQQLQYSNDGKAAAKGKGNGQKIWKTPLKTGRNFVHLYTVHIKKDQNIFFPPCKISGNQAHVWSPEKSRGN